MSLLSGITKRTTDETTRIIFQLACHLDISISLSFSTLYSVLRILNLLFMIPPSCVVQHLITIFLKKILTYLQKYCGPPVTGKFLNGDETDKDKDIDD